MLRSTRFVKLALIVMLVMLALSASLPVSAAEKPIQVTINGEVLALQKTHPIMKDGTVLVPFRALFEKLGLKVGYDAATKIVKGEKAGLVIELKVGKASALVNGKEVKLPVAPISVNGTTYVPTRFVGEATGNLVVWDKATRTVVVTVKALSEEDAMKKVVVDLMSTEDYKTILSYLSSDSILKPVFAALEKYNMLETDTYNAQYELEVVEKNDQRAAVYVEYKTETAATYRMSAYVFQLVKENNTWKVYSFMQEGVSGAILKPDYEKTARTVEAANEKEANLVQGMVGVFYNAFNERDLEGLMIVHSDIQLELMGEESLKAQYQQLFQQNFTIDPINTAVLRMDEVKASVYVNSEVTTNDGNKVPVEFIVNAVKDSNGIWRYYSEEAIIPQP